MTKSNFLKMAQLLCTHFGLSGPTILNSATQVADLLQSGDVKALIDAYPQFDTKALDEHILSVFDEHKNKDLKTVFRLITPPGTAKALTMLLPEVNLFYKSPQHF